jgi:hypothetical protein
MGCCHKKRKRNTLLKYDENEIEKNDEPDSNAIIVKLTYNDFIPLKL